jgi:hypothetical protein
MSASDTVATWFHKYDPVAVIDALANNVAELSTFVPPIAPVDAAAVIFAAPAYNILAAPLTVAVPAVCASPVRARKAVAVAVAAVAALASTKRNLTAAFVAVADKLAAAVVGRTRCGVALAVPDVAAVAAPAHIARGAAVAAISTAAVALVTRTANGVIVEFTLVLAVAAHWRKRAALPDVAADMAAAALNGRIFWQAALAVTATLAVADVFSESPTTVAVPAMTTAADASTERNLPAVAVADAEMLGVADAYCIAAGPTLADMIDAVRFAAGIAPDKTSFDA